MKSRTTFSLALALVASGIIISLSKPVLAAEPFAGFEHGEPRVTGRLATFTQTAEIGPARHLEAEFGYGASFRKVDLRHTGDVLVSYVAIPQLEFSLGWNMFEVVDDKKLKVEDGNAGAGEIYLRGKFGLPLGSAARPQGLSFLVELRPQIGQPIARTKGLDLDAFAQYSVMLSPVLLSLQAGASVNTAGEPAAVAVPVSVMAKYEIKKWSELYGEFVEEIRTNDLSSSATLLRLGFGFLPIQRLRFDVHGGVGLSTSTPDGFIGVGASFLFNEIGNAP